MHSRDLLDVIFLLGSFPVKKKKIYIEYMRDKGLVLLVKTLDIPKKDALNTNSAYEINHKCTVFNNTHTPSFKFSTCIACLPLNLCLPFTFIRLKHCPLHKY